MVDKSEGAKKFDSYSRIPIKEGELSRREGNHQSINLKSSNDNILQYFLAF